MPPGPDDTCTASNVVASSKHGSKRQSVQGAPATHTHPCTLGPLPWEQLQGGHAAGAFTRFAAWAAGYGGASAWGEGAAPERTAGRAVAARGLAHVSPAPTKAAGPEQRQAEQEPRCWPSLSRGVAAPRCPAGGRRGRWAAAWRLLPAPGQGWAGLQGKGEEPGPGRVAASPIQSRATRPPSCTLVSCLKPSSGIKPSASAPKAVI